MLGKKKTSSALVSWSSANSLDGDTPRLPAKLAPTLLVAAQHGLAVGGQSTDLCRRGRARRRRRVRRGPRRTSPGSRPRRIHPRQAQGGARAQRPAGVGQAAVVGVDAQRLVVEVDVVGPRQDLRVGALDVVALVERVDDDLPVGGQHGREIGPHPHPVEVVRGQQRRQRVEVLEQRRRGGVQADPDEATPPVDSHRPRQTPCGMGANSSGSTTSISLPSRS